MVTVFWTMNVTICYIYPTANHGAHHSDLAERFVSSYGANPPDYEHSTIVVSNGGKPSGRAVCQCSKLSRARFIEHDDSGMDIGGYQLAARGTACDIMVFFGGSSYFRKPGWLKRMVQAFEIHGDALYGCCGNQGDFRLTQNGTERVWPHIRTTGFWCTPKLVSQHPMRVTKNEQRYPYEHGPRGLTTWVLATGRKAWVVGWDDMKQVHECDSMPGTFHNGTQHNLLVGDRLTEMPYYPHP